MMAYVRKSEDMLSSELAQTRHSDHINLKYQQKPRQHDRKYSESLIDERKKQRRRQKKSQIKNNSVDDDDDKSTSSAVSNKVENMVGRMLTNKFWYNQQLDEETIVGQEEHIRNAKANNWFNLRLMNNVPSHEEWNNNNINNDTYNNFRLPNIIELEERNFVDHDDDMSSIGSVTQKMIEIQKQQQQQQQSIQKKETPPAPVPPNKKESKWFFLSSLKQEADATAIKLSEQSSSVKRRNRRRKNSQDNSNGSLKKDATESKGKSCVALYFKISFHKFCRKC